jgi:hypothetical protein
MSSGAGPDIRMALAEFLKEPVPAPAASPDTKPADPAAKLRKQVFLEFGAMVALGLLLAGWYVAYRIVAGRGGARVPQLAKITFAQPAVAPAPKVVSQPPPAQPIPSPPPLAESKPSLPVPAVIAKSGQPAPPLAHETKSATLPAPLAKETVLAKPVLSKAVPAQPEPVPQPVKRKEAIVQPFKRRGLTPRAGEKYLQIAAYGPRSLDDYLKTLEKQGMHPLVGPGPAENIYRILVGPLPNAEALEQTRHLIQSLGIEPILRSY